MLHPMRITVAHISARPRDELDSHVARYLTRCSGFAPAAAQAFKTEAAMMEWIKRQPGRAPVVTVLLDSRGRSMTSEAFAAWLGARRDDGAQHILFAIGPADGWSPDARRSAHLLLSLSSLTLAHALARLVLAEQIYRATTILTGHPYHGGHAE
jgi:23S rRNA (pseudouridine1915-N3)-methyltransferase